MSEVARRRLMAVGRGLVVIVVAAFVVAAGADRWDELSDVDLHLTPGWLLLAAPLPLAAGAVLPLAWRQLLKAYDEELASAVALRVWWLSQAARFVPGYVTWVGTRAALAGRAGISRRLAAASVVVEAGLLALWGCVLTIALPSDELPAQLRVALAMGAVVAMATLPMVVARAGRFLPTSMGVNARSVDGWGMHTATALYGLNAAMRSIGLVLVTRAVVPIGLDDAWLIIGATNAGMVIGMVGITPAGLGVREGAIAGLLAVRFGLGDAAALAVLYRGWDFAFELVWLLGMARSRGRKETGVAVVDEARQ